MCAKAKEDKEAKAAKKAAAKEEKAAKAKAKAKPKKKASTGTEDYNFFLLHGEKIGIAVALLVFAGLVASGSGLDKFTLTPEQINSSSSSAETTIKDSKVTPKEYDEGVVVYPFDSYAELIKSNVKVNSYETATRWEQSLFPDKIKRPNVVPLPLENLRAVACVGAIMYNAISANGAANAGGGMGGGMGAGGAGAGGMGGGMTGGMGGASGELKGRHWITLTGSIPIRKQQLAYNELFGNAQYTDDQRDQPRYIYFTLERGIVDPTGKTDWKKVDVIGAIQKENQYWSGVGSDQVGYNYMAPTWSSFPPMAMSCPPMANKPFGEEVANLPNIPLSSTEQIDVQASDVKEWNELQEAMKKFDESDLLSRNPFADVSMGGGAGMAGGMSGGMGMAGGMGMVGGGMMGSGMETGGGMGMSGGATGGAVGGNSWLVNQDAINESRMKIQQAASVDYYLFRYFDFEVEPDKTYVYRVKLILGNPNYGVDEHFVEDPSTLDKTFVESEFSAPSNPVALGAISRVLAENVEASSRPGAEPRITLSSVYFDEEDASESIIQGQNLKRGQVANFYSQKHDAVSVAGGRSSASMYDAMGMGSAGSKKGGKPKNKSVNHISNVCVVDALGGAKISGVTLRSPGKVLFLEPNGLLQIREVKEDARELGRYDNSAGAMGMGMGTGAAGMMM